MRAPLFTFVSLVALVAALLSSSLGAFDPAPPAAPLAPAEVFASEGPVPTTGVGAELLAPDAAARSEPASSTHAAAIEADPDGDAHAPDEAALLLAPSAWAAYDPRAERNARYRAESLPRALAGLTAADTGASLRVAYAISIETAAIFTELDMRRESSYVPDDGQPHPMTILGEHHSVACGGANYVFAEGRFPLYDTLVQLEHSSSSSPELAAWGHSCPLEAELRARHDEALQHLAAYR